MTDDQAIDNLKAMLRAMEQQSELSGELLEAVKLLRRRVDQLEESLDEALAALMNVPATLRLLLAMKAATLTMRCTRCGTVYAKEPGPELCGPCWVAAGRPGATGLYLIERTPTHEGSDPA